MIIYRHVGVSHNPTGTKTSAIITYKKTSSISKEPAEQNETKSRKIMVEVNVEGEGQTRYCSHNSIPTNNGRTKKETFLVTLNSHIPAGILSEESTNPKGNNSMLNIQNELP